MMIKINDRDFFNVVQFVRSRYGINLEHKRQLINARMSLEIKKCGYTDFTDYISNVISKPNGDDCHNMINRLSTNYTFFFRETEYIEKLCNEVLNDFISRGKNHINIWCAACSSGEEIYSIAMVLELYKKLHHISFDFEIIGTDINTEMIDKAINAKYDIDELSHIPEKYRQFTDNHSSNSFRISDSIRKKVSCQYRNLLDEQYDREIYDIIFCRNVMIYFTPSLRQKITSKLYSSLLSGGYLFTGATESIDFERKYFRYIAPTFYQKR